LKYKSNPVVFIPARGGSKRIKNKNMKKLGKKPLILIALENAFELSKNVYVSTDDKKISTFSQKAGAKLHKRPKYLAKDNSIIEDSVRHFIKNEQKDINLDQTIIILSPCSPFIASNTIKTGLRHFQNSNCDSLISSHKSYEDYWSISDGKVKRIRKNEPRRQQDRVPYYVENSAFYITKANFLLNKKLLIDGKVEIFDISKIEGFDINTLLDLQIANYIYQNKSKFV